MVPRPTHEPTPPSCGVSPFPSVVEVVVEELDPVVKDPSPCVVAFGNLSIAQVVEDHCQDLWGCEVAVRRLVEVTKNNFGSGAVNLLFGCGCSRTGPKQEWGGDHQVFDHHTPIISQPHHPVTVLGPRTVLVEPRCSCSVFWLVRFPGVLAEPHKSLGKGPEEPEHASGTRPVLVSVASK